LTAASVVIRHAKALRHGRPRVAGAAGAAASSRLRESLAADHSAMPASASSAQQAGGGSDGGDHEPEQHAAVQPVATARVRGERGKQPHGQCRDRGQQRHSGRRQIQVGGYTLTRPVSAISALDVVRAIEGDEPAYRCAEIRQHGPLAIPAEQCTRPCSIARAMAAAEEAWSRALAHISIADLAAGIDADSNGTAMSDLRRWLATVRG